MKLEVQPTQDDFGVASEVGVWVDRGSFRRVQSLCTTSRLSAASV